MIHCDPVVERWTSPWIVGSEIATIVWSMKVIETAKIIAARISFEFLPGVWFICWKVPASSARFLPPYRFGRVPT